MKKLHRWILLSSAIALGALSALLLTSIFTMTLPANAQAVPPIAYTFDFPLGSPDGIGYGTGTLGGSYGVPNPGLDSEGKCFEDANHEYRDPLTNTYALDPTDPVTDHVDWRDLNHAGGDVWKGNDLNAAAGVTVAVIADGTVIDVVDGYYYPGSAVRVEHRLPDGNAIYSVYMHLIVGQVRVNVNDRVTKGDTVGFVIAQTNNSHLH